MPPPASPSIPFGGIPSSESAGCSHQLATAEWPLLSQLVVKHAGVAGLGVFASGSIESGHAVCEYTGMLRVDPPSDDFDAYAFFANRGPACLNLSSIDWRRREADQSQRRAECQAAKLTTAMPLNAIHLNCMSSASR